MGTSCLIKESGLPLLDGIGRVGALPGQPV